MRITRFQLVGSRRIDIFVESTLEAAICPDCPQVSLDVHDVGRPQMIRDLSIWGRRRCWLVYAPRRFKCAQCRDTFVEHAV